MLFIIVPSELFTTANTYECGFLLQWFEKIHRRNRTIVILPRQKIKNPASLKRLPRPASGARGHDSAPPLDAPYRRVLLVRKQVIGGTDTSVAKVIVVNILDKIQPELFFKFRIFPNAFVGFVSHRVGVAVGVILDRNASFL